MPGFGLRQRFSLLDVPLVPDPHTWPARSEAPEPKNVSAPVCPAVTADSLGWEEAGEILPGQLQLGVVTQVAQQPLVTSLATVQAHLVTEHHLGQRNIR